MRAEIQHIGTPAEAIARLRNALGANHALYEEAFERLTYVRKVHAARPADYITNKQIFYLQKALIQ
jgi:hypothetical protein